MIIRLFLIVLLSVFATNAVRADVSLQAKVWLQGAYDPNTKLMRDELRSKNLLPSTQPYQPAPFNYSGSETVSASLLATTGQKAIVDWILLDVREPNSHDLLARRAFLLQRDGWLLDPKTNSNTLVFSGLPTGSYVIGIKHRNHLGILNASMNITSSPTIIDFTKISSAEVGRIDSTTSALVAGDVDVNHQIINSGPNSDVSAVLIAILGHAGNSQYAANYRIDGYSNNDLNLDGSTLFAGPNNDTDILRTGLLMHPSNTNANQNFLLQTAPKSQTITTQLNLAQSFGMASQGTDYNSTYLANLALDGKLDTFNHTACDTTNNWWQVKLPDALPVNKIVITSRAAWGARLKDAAVYLSNAAYTGTPVETEKVATLLGVDTPQTFNFATPKTANYLIVKAVDSNCLHMAEVELYGLARTAPVFANAASSYLIAYKTPDGTPITSVSAIDYQKDAIQYSIEGSVPFAVNSQGQVSVKGVLNAGTSYQFAVLASDGKQSSRLPLTVNTTASDAVAKALSSGSIAAVTDTELLDAALAVINDGRDLLADAKIKLFNLNSNGSAKTDGSSLTAIDWDPSANSSFFVSTYGVNVSVLRTNAVYVDGNKIQEKELGIIGTKSTSTTPTRYMLLGGSPFRSANLVNAQMEQFMENSLSWLIGRTDLKTASFNVVLAHLGEHDSTTRAWLDKHYPNMAKYNTALSCEDDKLKTCLTNSPNILIISHATSSSSDATVIANTIQEAISKGIPVLYLYLDWNTNTLSEKLLAYFDASYQYHNYWDRLGLKSYNVATNLGKIPSNIESINTVLKHFKAKDYAFDWSACKSDDCSPVIGLDAEFKQGADATRNMLTGLDKAKVSLFKQSGLQLQKLLTLLGDAYRQQVRFPMDKVSTNTTTFTKALFADHAVYQYRDTTPIPPDMGNFSRSNFSHITPVTKQITMISRRNFKSTGVYALPGKTFKVTRTDTSQVNTKLFINTLRAGATHEYESFGYKRPKYLQSVSYPLQVGETISITPTYGGPIAIEFDTNDLSVSFTFEQVGEHPFWDDVSDNATFEAKLKAGEYDWAEFITPAFEIHSKLDKMRESISDARWGGTLEGFAAATMRYTYNFPHVLAGFKGPHIDVVPEIHDFATANSYTIDNLDMVKHMNADQATCGYGCSGNPYDAYWAFKPINHGDIHELGHGLEKWRIKFGGWETHTMTNPYAYYTKSQYFKTTGGDPECQELPFEKIFKVLQASRLQTDPAAYVKTNLWDSMGWSEGAATFVQIFMSAQDQGVLKDGWHLLARLHIMEREFARATADATKWSAKRASLGFDTYSLDEAKALNQNDWLLVAISYATGRDYRKFFEVWALPYNTKAGEQVALRQYPSVTPNFFISSPAGYCKGEGFDGKKLLIDGTKTWPVTP